MSIAARRLARAHTIQYAANAVELYTGTNYTGSVLRFAQHTALDYVGATFNDQVKSIKIVKPSKVYLYLDNNFQHDVLYTAQSIPDLSLCYFWGTNQWSQGVTGIRVEHITYQAPYVTNASPLALGDGSTIIVYPGSERFGNCDISTVVTDIQDQAVYDDFVARVPANIFKVAFEQMSRNVCSILYASPDDVPNHHTVLTLRFINDPGTLAYCQAEVGAVTYGGGSVTASQVASFTTHEVCHLYQHAKDYGSTPYATGTVEGVADYVLVEMGYHPVYLRPYDGGANWYDGYDTTAFFFDYIQNRAPVASPRFIKDLVQTMNSGNPAVGNTSWDPAVITTINAQRKTVDQLWADYKAWVTTQ